MISPMSDCLFCAIVDGDIPATVVRDTDRVLAFRDVSPVAPTHILVVPKQHYANIAELAGSQPSLMAEMMSEIVAVAAAEDLPDAGYRVVFNSGVDGGQTVDHVHAHVLGGRPMKWPPG